VSASVVEGSKLHSTIVTDKEGMLRDGRGEIVARTLQLVFMSHIKPRSPKDLLQFRLVDAGININPAIDRLWPLFFGSR
jgi:hypothetical protein